MSSPVDLGGDGTSEMGEMYSKDYNIGRIKNKEKE